MLGCWVTKLSLCETASHYLVQAGPEFSLVPASRAEVLGNMDLVCLQKSLNCIWYSAELYTLLWRECWRTNTGPFLRRNGFQVLI